MQSGAWRPQVKLQLRPHQPELFDSAERRIEPPAFTGIRGHSSKRSLRRRRGTAAARGSERAGNIAMGAPYETASAGVPRHDRDSVAMRVLLSTRF
jgi:hypothetical protein